MPSGNAKTEERFICLWPHAPQAKSKLIFPVIKKRINIPVINFVFKNLDFVYQKAIKIALHKGSIIYKRIKIIHRQDIILP